MIPNPYVLIGGLVLLVAVALGGLQTGRKLERSTWQAKELATARRAALELQAAHERAQRIQTFNEAKARKASADHEKALSDLDQKYAAALAAARAAGGLRIPRSACGPAPAAGQSPSPGRPDEASAATVKLPDRVESDLFALTKRADALAEQLRGLQAWVKDNGHYGPSK